MNQFKSISSVILLAMFLLNNTSCVVVSKKDNGKHKGWYKNTNNPHNPATTKSGKTNGNSNGKGKSKK